MHVNCCSRRQCSLLVQVQIGMSEMVYYRTSPQSMGGQFYRKFLTKEPISKPLKKSLNITLLPLVLQDDL